MDRPNPSRRTAFALAGTLAAAALLPGVAHAQEQIRIRFAHSLSTSEPAHQAAEFFAKNVAARTNGRVQIQVFPGEQLGPGKEVNEMIRQGANVMNITDPGYLSDFVPEGSRWRRMEGEGELYEDVVSALVEYLYPEGRAEG